MRRLLLIFMVMLTPTSWSIDSESLTDPVLQKRYQSIIYELRCLVCQNQSIQDSDAQLAKDLRRQTREMLTAGRSDLEIMDYMVERYGEYVRYRPALRRSNLGLYLAPAFVGLLGLIMFGTTLRRHLASADQEDLSGAVDQRASEEVAGAQRRGESTEKNQHPSPGDQGR